MYPQWENAPHGDDGVQKPHLHESSNPDSTQFASSVNTPPPPQPGL